METLLVPMFSRVSSWVVNTVVTRLEEILFVLSLKSPTGPNDIKGGVHGKPSLPFFHPFRTLLLHRGLSRFRSVIIRWPVNEGFTAVRYSPPLEIIVIIILSEEAWTSANFLHGLKPRGIISEDYFPLPLRPTFGELVSIDASFECVNSESGGNAEEIDLRRYEWNERSVTSRCSRVFLLSRASEKRL